MKQPPSTILRTPESIFDLDRSWYWLALLLVFLAIHNLWWLHCDIIDPLWDEAVYLLCSKKVFEDLKETGIFALRHLYFFSEGPRPLTFFSIFSSPFYAIFGITADIAIFSTNTIFYSILILSTFLLGRHLFDKRTGLLASFVVALAPGVSILSRIYWPHFSVIAIVPLGTYLLLKSDSFSRTFPSLGFGLLLGFGLMIRPVYPALFLLAPLTWTVGQALIKDCAWSEREFNSAYKVIPQIKKNIFDRLILRAAPSIILALIVAGPYYLPKLIEVYQFASKFQQINKEITTSEVFWYLKHLPEFISPFICLLFAIGVVFALWRLQFSTLFMMFSLIGTFFIVSIPSFKKDYYLPPVFPLISIAATYWIFFIENVWVQRTLVAMTVVMSLGAFFVSSWESPIFTNYFLRETFQVQSSKPNLTDWQMPKIADLIRLDSGQFSAPKVGFIGNAMLHMKTFRYLAGSNANNFTYVPPAFPPFVQELDTLLSADYVVIARPKKKFYIQKQSLLKITRQNDFYWHCVLWDKISGGDGMNSTFLNCHHLVGTIKLEGGMQIEIFGRTQPLSPDEILNLSSDMIGLSPEIAILQLEHILERKESLSPDLLEAYTKSLSLAKARE